jgi:uncharacterized integral membrane protein
MVEERHEPEGSDARDAARVIAVVVLVALLIAFVVANTREVKVGYVFGTHKLRLIYILVITFALGVVVDRLWQSRRRRRQDH